MAAGWFISSYDQLFGKAPGRRTKRCIISPAVNRYIVQIKADGGWWSAIEILGERCLVKVKASITTLQTIAADSDIKRLPKNHLNDSLSDLSTNVKQAIKTEILAMGYTMAEVQARFPNDLRTYTLRDVLKFVATRRKIRRYDPVSNATVWDGADTSRVRDIEGVEKRITD